jgi:phosphoribosyl-AMP cyclohydrolase
MDSIREAVKFFGWTVGPTAPPLDLVPTVWLDTLSSYTSQSLLLGWITTQAIADKYLSYFSSARAELVQGDSAGARTPLQQVLRDVDIDSTTNLTSEAYALIRYNTEYLLSQLPAGQEGVSLYSLFATHSMWLKENAKVY